MSNFRKFLIALIVLALGWLFAAKAHAQAVPKFTGNPDVVAYDVTVAAGAEVSIDFPLAKLGDQDDDNMYFEVISDAVVTADVLAFSASSPGASFIPASTPVLTSFSGDPSGSIEIASPLDLAPICRLTFDNNGAEEVLFRFSHAPGSAFDVAKLDRPTGSARSLQAQKAVTLVATTGTDTGAWVDVRGYSSLAFYVEPEAIGLTYDVQMRHYANGPIYTSAADVALPAVPTRVLVDLQNGAVSARLVAKNPTGGDLDLTYSYVADL